MSYSEFLKMDAGNGYKVLLLTGDDFKSRLIKEKTPIL